VSWLAHDAIAALPPGATTDGEHRILRSLADCVNRRSGLLWPAIGYLHTKTGYKPRYITLCLRRFEERGWLAGVGRRGRVTVYDFALLKTLSKTRGKPVEDAHQRSLPYAPAIAEQDPGCTISAVSDTPVETSRSDPGMNRELNQERRAERRGAPPTPLDRIRFEQVKANLASGALVDRRRRA
jgi:hypothetical protein